MTVIESLAYYNLYLLTTIGMSESKKHKISNKASTFHKKKHLNADKTVTYIQSREDVKQRKLKKRQQIQN